MMPSITLYTTRFCPYCVAARQLLQSKGVEFTDIPVDGDSELRQQMAQRAGQQTVPQIWIGDTHVGGYTDLAQLERSGEFDRLIGAGEGD